MSVSKAPSPQALIDAIRNDDVEAVRQSLTPELLEQPIDAGGRHPLGMAVVAKSAQVVDLLLESGASPLYFDRTGLSPLDHGMAIADARILDHLRDGVERVRGRWQSRLARFARDYQALLAPLAGPEPEPVPDAGEILAFLTDGDQADAMAVRLQQLCARRAGQTPPDFPWLEHRLLLNDIGVLDAERRQPAFLARWIMLETPFFSLPEQVAGRRAAGVSQLRFQVQMEAITRAVKSGFLDAGQWIEVCVKASLYPSWIPESLLLDLVDEATQERCREDPDVLGEEILTALEELEGLIHSIFGSRAVVIGQVGGYSPAPEESEAPPASDADEADALRHKVMDETTTDQVREQSLGKLVYLLDELLLDEELLSRWQHDCVRVWCSDPWSVMESYRHQMHLRDRGKTLEEIRQPQYQHACKYGKYTGIAEADPWLPESWLQWLWQHRSGDDGQRLIIRGFLHAGWGLGDDYRQSRTLALLHDWIREDPASTEQAFQSLYTDWQSPGFGSFSKVPPFHVAADAWEWLSPTARMVVLQMLASQCEIGLEELKPIVRSGARTLLQWGMAEHPECLLATPASARFVLPMLCEQGFEASVPSLRALARRREIREPAVQGLSRIPLERLQTSGLLKDRNKAARLLALEALFVRKDPEAARLLRESLQQKGWNERQRGWMLDWLEELGEDVSSLDPLLGPDFAAFETVAVAGMKGKRSDPLERLWNPHIEALDLPVSRTVLQWCAFQVQEEAGVPRAVRQLWQRLEPETRIELLLRLFEAWSEGAADNRDRWILHLVEGFGDDRIVQSFESWIRAYGFRYTQRCCRMIRTLAILDTLWALRAIDSIRLDQESSDLLTRTATEALQQAAAQRGFILEELLDELTPTLGMDSDGLVLDVGPWCYRVLIHPDLTLRVINEKTGRQTKSLPKAKTEEDPHLRAVAEERFKVLKKGMRALNKRVQRRLKTAFRSGRSWSVARWRSLFFEHPILHLVGRNLLWTVNDESGIRSFRISEDASLIDHADEPVTLGTGRVRLWLPLDASEEEVAGWREHLAAYEIDSFLEQVDALREPLTAQEAQAMSLDRWAGCEVYRNYYFEEEMTGIGYQPCSEGGYIHAFVFRIPESPLQVEISVSSDEPDSDAWEWSTFTLGSVRFLSGDDGERRVVPLGEVPAFWMASVISLLNFVA